MTFKQKSSPLNQFGSALSFAGSGTQQKGYGIQSAISFAGGGTQQKDNGFQIGSALSLAGGGNAYSNAQSSMIKNALTRNSWKDNYWENQRKAEFARGKAEVQAEIASRQKVPVVNTVDRAGMPIKADPNAIVQPQQPPPPVDITQNATAISNNDYNLRNMTPQTPISPKAFSNQGTIQNMYGQAMQGTFNRSVGSPFAQMADPLTGQYIDPTMDQSPDDPGPDPSLPQQPPVDVATPIAPVYDINNY